MPGYGSRRGIYGCSEYRESGIPGSFDRWSDDTEIVDRDWTEQMRDAWRRSDMNTVAKIRDQMVDAGYSQDRADAVLRFVTARMPERA